ncbi:Clathrin/coatomer adaptor, adaptin-like, N-terminal [Kalmanozyma brasiliensis GHG001]|uniref:Clathrin/coatomer adaptor, adaptin-like, N-terminal n=1 Tax=Kalmanozyma brasiliensis (strain GHG001) TaxID=1365824 RepID=UPI002867E889|nr:Clathrin/coatomer adaptor, adaptin-like, N-terminal [Kalmanozyma brasiliensis GHG001]EST04985.2 Clathrin/coatomer adaptor, adaptin-like, N-terminal [Kalmanozyma brasiliensis GHG001]
MSAAYSNSSRALAFLSETSEDAIATLKGLVGGVGSAKYLDTSEDKLSTIATQIDSSRDEDRIAALTRIVAMISKGRDASSFLPAVLKLTSSSNLDVRKLVYIVLLRYANSNPDLTLLSINSFQRDLSDPSPLIRAMALRVLSSIKVSMVAPIVIMAVTKASRDPNLYVRKIAALAIPKCHQIDRSQLDSLQEVLATLLADRSPYVLGAALSAFQRMCPTNWQLLHQNYRRICHALSDMDEWGQITAIQVLSRYARANLVQPPIRGTSALNAANLTSSTKPSTTKETSAAPPKTGSSIPTDKSNDVDGLESFLSTEASTSIASAKPSNADKAESSTPRSPSDLDRDLELLLSKSHGLLRSRNPAVVLAVARLILYLSPTSDHILLVRPLVRLVRSTPDISYIVLLNILAIARQHRYLFAPHVTSFLLGPSHEEPLFLSLLKLDVLVAVCNTGNLDLVLTEIASHMRSADASIAAHAVSCLGELALSKELEAGSRCLAILLDLLRKRKSGPRIHDSTIARAVLVIKNLLQLSSLTGEHAVESKRTSAIVYRLAALLFGTPPKSAEDKSKRKTKPKVIGKGAIMHPDARASIIWLLGQHARSSISVSTPAAAALPNGQGQESKTLAELVIPDVLRRCALNFANESPVVKLQILTMSSKAFAFLPTVLMSTPALGEGGKGRGEGLAGTVTTLHFYLLKLARYDANFDVRDRARFLKGLTAPLITQKMVVGEGEGATEDTIQGAIEAAARAMGEGSTEDGDADLKGVRLRREQVIHVLFEGKLPSTTTDTTVTESDATGGPELASLSLVLGGKLVKGWLDTILPPWTTTPTPSALREPPAAQSTQTTLQNTSLANAKSFSSSDFSSLPVSMPVTLTPKGAVTPTSKGSTTPIELEAGTTSVQTQQRYKDLDSFLDESDEDEVQQPYLDDSAPEDEEFAAGEDVWDDDDEEEEDEEDSSSEEDDE